MICEWAAQYIGIPYADQGRDRHGVDCWGLVCMVLGEQFGKLLPSLADEYSTCLDQIGVETLVEEQRPLITTEKVDNPFPGDIVLARLRGFLCHVGVYVGDGCMLHVRAGTNSVIDRIRTLIWAKRIEGFYRVP